jgi:signal transduction histidine kinase
MIELYPSLLEQFPEAVLLADKGLVSYANTMARHYLPKLTEQAPLPPELDLPLSAAKGAGVFTSDETRYSFSMTLEQEKYLIVFRPAAQDSLTDRQVSGFLHQLRNFLGEFAAELGPMTIKPEYSVAMSSFVKSYHRTVRLVNNLDFLHRAESSDGVHFRPIPMDIAGLCRQTVEEAAPLLAQTGVELCYDTPVSSLLIPGDPALLQQMLLELVSNAVREAMGGVITLKLNRQGQRAILTLSHTGAEITPRQLAGLLQQESEQGLPLPNQGAGLGMPVVRHIVSLHHGSLLVELGQTAPSVFISLPTGPLTTRLSVETPRFDDKGGLSPLLVGLADVLPARMFGQSDLD